MRCPVCGDEYEAGVDRCAECDVPLGGPAPPRVDAALGVFHPAVGRVVAGVLDREGVAFEAVPVEDTLSVVVDRERRDALRAELLTAWPQVLGAVEPDLRREVVATGGSAPGWFDAPAGGWIDRDGRLQVDAGEERVRDAERAYGPALVAAGVLVGLLGWIAGEALTLGLLGGALVVVGLLLPR